MTQYLPTCLNKEKKLKQNWAIYNCGIPYSTSRDWLPISISKKPTRLSKLLNSSLYSDASMVILLVGYHDAFHGISAESTFENILQMSNVLADMGKYVYICPTANWGDDGLDNSILETHSKVNELLVSYFTNESLYIIKD